MKRNLTCIVCPRGCSLVADIEGEKIAITGQGCPRGESYAVNECLHPMRTVTIALRVANRVDTMVSVKTEQPVPKEKMADVVAQLCKMTVNAPIVMGDVLCGDICGSRIVVTKTVL